MSDLVSVIIPCHQQGHLLHQAIESVLAQTHDEYEIIIVNDGSTDSTGLVALDYYERLPERIKVLEHPNRGQARSREAGLARASGDYLVLLDADDLLEPAMMASCLQIFKNNPHVDMVVGDAWLIDAEGSRLRPWPQQRIASWPEILRNNPYGALAAVMTRTSAVRALGGLAVDGVSGVEDWDLWVRLARCNRKFAALERTVASYRQSPASTSHKAARMLQATCELLERCRRPDPRLAEAEAAGHVKPPISDRNYQALRNGKTFKSLGLALACAAEPEEIRTVLGHFVPGAIDVRYASDQFLEGIHYGFFLKLEQTLPEELNRQALLAAIEEALPEFDPPTAWPKLREAIEKTLDNPLRKRSLLTRIRERIFS